MDHTSSKGKKNIDRRQEVAALAGQALASLQHRLSEMHARAERLKALPTITTAEIELPETAAPDEKGKNKTSKAKKSRAEDSAGPAPASFLESFANQDARTHDEVIAAVRDKLQSFRAGAQSK